MRERLPGMASVGRVQAVFRRACTLVLPGGEPLSLVLPEIGDGPLNVVVASQAGLFDALSPGMPASLSAHRLAAGDVEVGLDTARIWEPRPDWQALRPRRQAVATRLGELLALASARAPDGSLLALLTDRPPGERRAAAIQGRARQAAADLRAGWDGDEGRLRAGSGRLAGLGAGLTPAGDDFLAGLMLWAWLAHETPPDFCRAVVETAAPRTTQLAAAFLRAAARGECSAAWHGLLVTLAGLEEGALAGAVGSVLAYGQTSGADTLAGFLWLSECP